MGDRIAAYLGAFATVVAAIIGALVLQDAAQKGPEPPRKLEQSVFAPSDPLVDLNKDGSALSVEVRSPEGRVTNIRVVTTFIENTGSAPITPKDIIEPLTVKVDEGWSILNVITTSEKFVKAKWTRVNDQEYQASPSLLNPGDLLVANVYLSFEGDEPPDFKEGDDVLEWGGRIVNLSHISRAADPFKEFARKAGPFVVTLWIWPIIFILMVFAVKAYYLISSSMFRSTNLVGTRAFLIVSLVLTLCGTEATASLIFGSSPTDYYDQPIYLNLPIILIDMALLGLAFISNRKSLKAL